MDSSFVFVIVIVFFLGIAGLIFYLRSARKKESWKGTVIEKYTMNAEDANDGSITTTQTVCYIVVQVDGGANKKVNVNKKLYDSFNKGDRVEKKSGEYNPVKV